MLTAAVNAVLVLLMAVLVVRVLIYDVRLGLLLGAVSAFFARGLVRDAVRAVRWARIVGRWERMGRPVGPPRRAEFAEQDAASGELAAAADDPPYAEAPARDDLRDTVAEARTPVADDRRDRVADPAAREPVAQYRAPRPSGSSAAQLELPLGAGADERRDTTLGGLREVDATRKPGSGTGRS